MYSLLNHDACTLRDEDEVGKPVNNHRALALLDDVREDRERGREGAVAAAREDVDVRAL